MLACWRASVAATLRGSASQARSYYCTRWHKAAAGGTRWHQLPPYLAGVGLPALGGRGGERADCEEVEAAQDVV